LSLEFELSPLSVMGWSNFFMDDLKILSMTMFFSVAGF
jgi:hypothetical protein